MCCIRRTAQRVRDQNHTIAEIDGVKHSGEHADIGLGTGNDEGLGPWQVKVSPSAYLMVDPKNGARAVIRETGADAGRFLWSVLVAGEVDPMSEGRTDDLAQAKSIAEAAVRAYAENRFWGA
jgi:hypothetical protein